MDRVSPFVAPLIQDYKPLEKLQRRREASRKGGLARQAKMSPEERKRLAGYLNRAGTLWWQRATPEERHRRAVKAGRASVAKRDPKKNAAMLRRATARRTFEERSAASRKAWSNMTPEKRAAVIARLRKFAFVGAQTTNANRWKQAEEEKRQGGSE